MDDLNLTNEQIEAIQFGNLARKILANKKTKSAFERLAKEVSPDIETSEDLAEPLLSPLRAQLKDVTDQLNGIKQAGEAYHKDEARKSLRAAGYTDEGLTKIEEIAASKGLKDLNDAAAIFDKTNPVIKARVNGVSPQNYGNDIFNLQDNTAEKLDMLFNNTDAFIASEVEAVNQEFAKNQE